MVKYKRYIFLYYHLFSAGVIVDDRWVLSAAHCVHNAKTIQVDVGQWNRLHSDNGEFRVKAAEWVAHPNAGATNGIANDVVMIKVPSLSRNKPKSCTGCYQMACLPTDHVSAGEHCWVSGWNMHHSDQSNKLREKGINVFQHDYCIDHSTYSKYDVLVNSEFCAGDPNWSGDISVSASEDQCPGDSGSPLICDNGSGSPTVFGIVSWGIACASAGNPGVFAKVASYTQWINEIMDNTQ